MVCLTFVFPLFAGIALLSSFSVSLANAEDLTCGELTTFSGGSKEYELNETFSLSIRGFNPIVKYVSAPDSKCKVGRRVTLDILYEGLTQSLATLPVLKINAASEDPVVILDSDKVIVSTASCVGEHDSKAPSPAPSGSAATMAVPALLALPFLSFGGYIPFFLATLVSLPHFSSADTVDECVQSIDIEISVPYSCPYDNFINGVCKTPKQIADMTIQALFVDFDVQAAEALLAEDYIQHNPTVPTGAAPVLAFLPALKDSGLAIETHRTLQEGNLVAYHSTYTNASLFGGETLIGFDVFRVENGKVQEHWDNLQELAGPNPNGNTMVDGPTMIKYLSETEANKDRALALVNGVLVEGNVSVAPLLISTEEYTQHNPTIADGLDGLALALQELAAQNLSFVYDSVQLVVAEGNFVLTGSPGEFGAGNPTAYYDLFRLQDGLIVEHWDVIQSIPSEFAHSNGKF